VNHSLATQDTSGTPLLDHTVSDATTADFKLVLLPTNVNFKELQKSRLADDLELDDRWNECRNTFANIIRQAVDDSGLNDIDTVPGCSNFERTGTFDVEAHNNAWFSVMSILCVGNQCDRTYLPRYWPSECQSL